MRRSVKGMLALFCYILTSGLFSSWKIRPLYVLAACGEIFRFFLTITSEQTGGSSFRVGAKGVRLKQLTSSDLI